jgi:hypothetical protein
MQNIQNTAGMLASMFLLQQLQLLQIVTASACGLMVVLISWIVLLGILRL